MSRDIPNADQLDKMFDRLGSDDAYREKFLGDPVAALAEHGVHVDPSAVPAVRSLPSKQAMQTQRAALRSKADGRAALAFFALGA